MTLCEEQKRVQEAMNTTLSGLQADPWLARRVLANTEGEEPVRRKASASLIVLLAVLLLSMTALAASLLWRDAGEKVAPMEGENGYYDTWNLDAKMELIRTLRDLGELADDPRVDALLDDSNLSAEEKERRCDAIMTAYVNGTPDTVTLQSILEKLHGDMNTWSMEDLVWYHELLRKTGLLSEEDVNYVLPTGDDLTQEEAVRVAVDFLKGKGAQHLDEAQIEAILTDEDGQRTWSVTFRLALEGQPYGGSCNVTETAQGEVLTYSLPDLVPLFVTGTLPDANAIPEAQASAIGRKAIAEALGLSEDDLAEIKTFFGYIDYADEALAHAALYAHVWAVTAAHNVYALLTPNGQILYVGSSQ